MENSESTRIPLPHNLPGGEVSIKKIKKLVDTAIELGGTVYEVAGDSGLLSASHFLELAFDEQITPEKVLSEDMTVVTEVYVHFPETGEMDRIFLWSKNAAKDCRLKEEGCIQDGKLVIEYDRLQSLHEKGYHCLYHRSADGHNGKSFVRYQNAFGNDRKMLPFQLWDNSFSFVGNGFNQALLVRTAFETVFVMPDIYAVQESIKVYHAENIIREKYNANFSAERIPVKAKVTEELKNIRKAIFGRSEMSEYKELRNSYRRLIYQIAHIKVFYPDVYATVWSEEFSPDDEKARVNFDEAEAVLAISLSGYDNCYGVCLLEDGSLKRVPNLNCLRDIPLEQKYKFRGYGDILNAGVAGSRMALIMKDILQSAEFMLDVNVAKIYVTHVGDLPDVAQITEAMKKRRAKAEKKGNAETNVSLIAYEEIADQNLDGLGLIKWAAKQAKIPEIVYVDSITAVVNAYEKADERNQLKNQEIALIYDFSESNVVVTLVRKQEDASLEVIAKEEDFAPELGIYDEHEIDEDEYNPSLEWVLGNSMDHFMMNAGLRALGITGENEVDEEAFEELRSSAPRVKRQLRRNDIAKIFFNNGYLSMVEDFPIDRLESCFEPVLKKNERFLRDVIREAGLSMEDIAKVYLAGEETEYPFVRKRIAEITQKSVCRINASQCAAARGAVLSGVN